MYAARLERMAVQKNPISNEACGEVGHSGGGVERLSATYRDKMTTSIKGRVLGKAALEPALKGLRRADQVSLLNAIV